MKKRDNCRLCHSKDLSLVLSLAKSALANAFVKQQTKQDLYPLDLFKCNNCKHFQLLDIVDPEVLFKNYIYVSGTSSLMRQHFRDYACKTVLTFNLQENDFICDIGSNDGTLLKYFKALGMRVLGIDPAENVAKKATENGIPTISDFFNAKLANDIVKNHGKAKIITSNNCFAHVDNLDEIVLGVKELLEKDGVFIFEVSYFLEVLKSSGFDQIYHEHVSFHTLYPLIQFFKRFDLKIVDVLFPDVHGGSLRVFVKHKESMSNNNLFSNYQDKICNDEIIEIEEMFGNFVSNIENQKKLLKQKLIDLKNKGYKISGFGASAKSTTFLHHFDIGKDLLDCIYDDAIEKQGLFSPGKNIPIKPFKENDSDYILILSFNFVDHIIKNNKFDGIWLVPLPSLKEIKGNS